MSGNRYIRVLECEETDGEETSFSSTLIRNSGTIYLRVPANVVYKMGLKPGDMLYVVVRRCLRGTWHTVRSTDG